MSVSESAASPLLILRANLKAGFNRAFVMFLSIAAGLPGLALTVAVLFFLPALPAAAADTAGVIESRKVIFQHPGFDAAARRLLEFERRKKEEALQAMEAETDPDKRAEIFKNAAQETAEREDFLMSSIRRDCGEALEAVMKKKKITIVFEKDEVYLGGLDITEDIIKEVKAAAGKKK
ncbi:MAG: OmpH family outer membrane protein [Synergistaceae bacterium]|nr:OmpH family outer membrane protein [Synergistaceae bacterium]